MILRKAIALQVALLLSAQADSRLLSWEDNPERNIASYRVYYRTAFDSTEQFLDVGRNTQVVLRNLETETKYFCRLTVFNVFGLESPPSPEITFFTAPRTPTLQRTASGLQMSTQGRVGGTLDLFESDDLKKWNLVTTIINSSGTIDLSQYVNLSGDKKFFKLSVSGDTIEGWLVTTGETDPDAPYLDTGLSNRLAYSYGLDLTGDLSTTRPRVGTVLLPQGGSNAQRYATFQFTMRESTRDVVPIIEASNDLESWSDVTSNLEEHTSVLNGNGTRTIVMREPITTCENGSCSRFFRLRFDTDISTP